MGVHGLWKLIDSAGKPIPIETLENKILAVDVSIWLYQLVRGMQDSRPGQNAFLLGLFHRICKLLFFRIKPIFVFDGGVPQLKRKTIAARQKKKNRAYEFSEELRSQLLKNLLKQQALGNITKDSIKIPASIHGKPDDLFRLPPLNIENEEQTESSGDEYEEDIKFEDCENIDITSEEFAKLPADIRHDMLTELKERRKLNSWAKVHLMPQESKDFSSFQMEKLLKRRAVQVGLEKAEEELGTRGLTLTDLETVLSEQGVDLSQRIAADNKTRFIYSGGVEKSKEKREEERLEDSDELLENKSEKMSRIVANFFSSQYEKGDIVKNSDTNYSEHEKPKTEDNKRVKLDHENIPQEVFHCEMSQKDAPLFCNQKGSSTEVKNIFKDVELDKKDQLEEKTPVSINESKTISDNQEESDSDHEFIAMESESNEKQESDSDEDFVEVPLDNSDNTLIIQVQPENIKDDDDDMFADIFNVIDEKNSEKDNNACQINSLDDPCRMDDEGEKLKTQDIEKEEAEIPENDHCKNDDDGEKFKSQATGKEEEEEEEEEEEAEIPENINPLTEAEINEMKRSLEKESNKLVSLTKREEKVATSISEQITLEAQELLQLFGIPYLIAPMEAEAQCAYLDLTGQTEGTITEDSDIWLFGAKNVYKNFFDNKKFVKQFKATDIQQCYHLKREDLIMIAMLVGSDYTTGVAGVGPVNAIEIVAHFPPEENSDPVNRLKRFHEDYKNSKLSATLSKHLRTLQFNEGFPCQEIVKAYTLPTVDDSKEKFKWSDPNINLIRQFTQEKFGWDINKTNSVLKPVIEKIKQKTTQRTMHNYYGWSFDNKDPGLSKRVGKAVSIMNSGAVPGPSKIRKVTTSTSGTNVIVEKVVKSKTPAQIARERAAKKLKEIKQREQSQKRKKKEEKK